jgi:O-antigen/teichoic acid export membrane protein
MPSVIETAPPEETTNRRVATNAVVYFAGQCVSWVVTFLTLSLIPRKLGEAAWGQLAAIGSSAVVMGTVFMFGMEGFLVAAIGRDRTSSERLVRVVIAIRLLAVPGLVAGIALLVLTLHPDRAMWILAYYVIASQAITLLSDPLRAVLTGLEEAKNVSFLDIIQVSLPLTCVPFLSHGPSAYMVALCAANAVTLILRWKVLRGRISTRPMFDKVIARSLLLGGAPFVLNDLTMSLYGFTSIFVLRSYAGDAATGEYGASQRLIGTFLFIPTALASAIMPAMARLNEVDPAELRTLQERVLGVLIVLAIPVGVMAVFLAEPFCRILYGPTKFHGVPLLLQLAAIKLAPIYVVTVCYRFLIAERKNGIWSFFLMGTVVVNVIASIFLVPLAKQWFHNGAAGAILAGTIAESMSMLGAFCLLRWNPLTKQFLAQMLRAAIAGGAMSLTLWLTRGLFIIIPAILGTLVFFVVGFKLDVLGKDEQRKLTDLIQSKLGKYLPVARRA